MLVGDRGSLLSTGPASRLPSLAFSPTEKPEASFHSSLSPLGLRLSIGKPQLPLLSCSLVRSGLDGHSSLSRVSSAVSDFDDHLPLHILFSRRLLALSHFLGLIPFFTLLPAGKVSLGVLFGISFSSSLEVIDFRSKDLSLECVRHLVGCRCFYTL